MKKLIALVFALIVATVAFGITASAVEITKPEISAVTTPEIHTLQEIPALPTKPEIPTVTTPEIPTVTVPEIHTLQEIPSVTTPEIPTNSVNTTNPADTEIPNTGSSIIAPVIAILVLAGGATVAVKAKKEN